MIKTAWNLVQRYKEQNKILRSASSEIQNTAAW